MDTEISFEHFVTLYALMQKCEKLDELYFGPLSTLGNPFSPDYEFGKDLIKNLINANIIKPKQPKYHSYTTLTKAGVEPTYEMVNWVILQDDINLLLCELINSGDFSDRMMEWGGQVDNLKRKLARAECKEFYEYSLNVRNLTYEFNGHSETLISNLLNDYSVSQCYQIFWVSAKYTVDFKARNPKIYRNVISVMNDACMRYSNRVKQYSWQIKGFERNVNIPRSMINYVLYEIILMQGDSGFTDKV